MIDDNDLCAELAEAQAGLSAAWRTRLLDAGVPSRALALGWAGVVNCVTDGDYYQPHESGAEMVVVPVKAMDDQSSPEYPDPAGVLLCGGVADLVAFRLDTPSRWYTRAAPLWLGCIPPQLLDPEPVRVWRTPLAWLRADGIGMVPLARDAWGKYSVLVTARRIIAEDVRHGDELQRILSRPFDKPLPPIMVPSPAGRRVAA